MLRSINHKLCRNMYRPLCMGVVLSFSPIAHAVQFVDSPALLSTVKEPVLPCKSEKTLQVPVITWGGDIMTIFANGGKTTQPNSLFGKAGLSFALKREDVFSNQVKSYLACKTPFLRGTLGMINLAAPVTDTDPKSKMVVIHQLTWSTGGDALVVKGGITKPADLKGKTIALQAYGPHIDYLGKILDDAGLTMKDVTIKWVKDLTGTPESPPAALRTNGVDAAVVIIPDGLALTSNGAVGTGAEDSVKGATILVSTKSASKIIADVYAVRSDFYEQNKEIVQKFVASLIQAQSELAQLWKQKGTPAYKEILSQSGQILFDSAQATKDVEGIYGDAELLSGTDNDKFFNDPKYPRNFAALNSEITPILLNLNLIDKVTPLKSAQWDYKTLGLLDQGGAASKQRFDTDQVAKAVMRKDQQGTLDQSSLFSFEVVFKPNQNSFSADEYEKEFKKVTSLASTYGGAVITIEGHSDPMAYLKQQKQGAVEVALNRLKQSAKNLSLTRAQVVRDALIKYAEAQSISLDPSQFAIVGHGISKPKSGLCGLDPCQPKSEKEWLSNMRVEFRIIQMEAEESVFKPL